MIEKEDKTTEEKPKEHEKRHFRDLIMHKKEKATEARSDGKTFGAVGAVGAAFPLMDALIDGWIVSDLAKSAKNKSASPLAPKAGNHKAAFIIGSIGVGALVYSLMRHSHADQIEAEIKDKENSAGVHSV